MNSRERLLAALNHREPDRIPIDLGGTRTSTISLWALENLKSHLGIRSKTRLMSSITMTAYPGDEIIKRFGIDVKMVVSNQPAGFKPRDTPAGSGRAVDEWGVVYQKDETAQTHFIVESEAPLHRATLKEEIERHPWPDPSDPSRVGGLRKIAKTYRREGFGVVLQTPLSIMTYTQWVRGLGQFMSDTILNQPFLEYLMDKIMEIQMEMTRHLLEEVGEYADVVVMGDDLSHQNGLIYSPDMYRKLFKPRHKKIIRFLKDRAPEAKILYHCCGAVEPLLRDLIELGVDAINPVQVGAAGMNETRKLKALYGRDLTFWGGIDTQRTLPFGTPEEVRTEVRRRTEDLAGNGGFVLAAVHNIRPEVKPQNICAMYEAALEYGRYPTKQEKRT
jgi:uroporphyrinogen decarboxylase